LDAAKRALSPELYAQEYECSFDAAVVGSVYGTILDAADAEGRIGAAPAVPNVPVDTSWDLGISDATAIWFSQAIGDRVRFVDYYEASGEGFAHFAKVLDARGYTYGRHIAPHDIAVRELGTGKSRIETARAAGIRFEVAPNLPVEDGIEAVRQMLATAEIDATKCAQGLEALRMYRREWDERNKVLRPRPVHDWTSHAADALRYRAVARRRRAPAEQKPVVINPGAWLS
jgi:hypothetical protein